MRIAEIITRRELPHYVAEGAFDIARGDVHLKGGVTGLRKAIGLCELFGLGIEIDWDWIDDHTVERLTGSTL